MSLNATTRARARVCTYVVHVVGVAHSGVEHNPTHSTACYALMLAVRRDKRREWSVLFHWICILEWYQRRQLCDREERVISSN